MRLHAYYTCPAGHTVAIYQDAWTVVLDERKEAERSLFGVCEECEILSEDGYCRLKLKKISQ